MQCLVHLTCGHSCVVLGSRFGNNGQQAGAQKNSRHLVPPGWLTLAHQGWPIKCTPVAPCHAPCASHPKPNWPRRQPSQHPLSQAPVQPPTGHRLGATRRQGKPPGWQRLCSRGCGPPRWPHNGCTGTQHPRLGKTVFLQVHPGAPTGRFLAPPAHGAHKNSTGRGISHRGGKESPKQGPGPAGAALVGALPPPPSSAVLAQGPTHHAAPNGIGPALALHISHQSGKGGTTKPPSAVGGAQGLYSHCCGLGQNGQNWPGPQNGTQH